ncbi:hypothetical protein [Ottowia sp.]|uniref:hypothetical protein n=1 Tax=Ottowia sp. TaxID=1898956 RepID=UPI0025FEA69B|nr:hypothetical protein [Ottowia sp.]MBK6616488.1 hypothetical protein [Ottowia sp.]
MKLQLRNLLAAVAGLVMCLGGAIGATDAQFNAANQVFQRANSGDKSAVDEAVSKFGDLVRAEPTNPVLLVHLGAATSMQARNTMLPWKKISYAEDGMALEDKAIALLTAEHDKQVQNGVPVSLFVRYVTANTFLAVPRFFNRAASGEKLLNEVLASPLFEASPLHFKGNVWVRAAKFATEEKRPDDARKYLDLVIKSGAPQADAAKAQLAAM